MFTLMLKQIYKIHELTKHSDDFISKNNDRSNPRDRARLKENKENPTTLQITEKLRKSIITRQKFFSGKEQLDLLRFLVNSLSVDTLREKTWTKFAKEVLKGVP